MKTKNKKLLTTDEEVAKVIAEKQTQYDIQCEKLDKLLELAEKDEYLKLSISFSIYMAIQAIIFLFLGFWETIKGVFKREKNN